MPTLGIDHYSLSAPRDLLEVLRSFYCGILGLEVGPRPPFNFFGYWLYASGRPVVHLMEARPDNQRATHVATTFDHLAFSCSDLEAMQQRLGEAQIPFRRTAVPPSGRIQLFLSDPAGNGVELIFV